MFGDDRKVLSKGKDAAIKESSSPDPVEALRYPLISEGNDSWATSDGIDHYLSTELGVKAHIMNAALGSTHSIFSRDDKGEAEKTMCDYLKKIVGFTASNGDVVTNGYIHENGGILTKPVVIPLNLSGAKASSAQDVNASGGSHWLACVVIPKEYINTEGMTIRNEQEQIFLIDSLNQTRTLPEKFKDILTKGTQYEFHTAEGKTVKHIILHAFPNAKFIEMPDNFKQQEGSSDCGWWAVANMLEIVAKGSADELMKNNVVKRATDLRRQYPLMDRSSAEIKSHFEQFSNGTKQAKNEGIREVEALTASDEQKFTAEAQGVKSAQTLAELQADRDSLKPTPTLNMTAAQAAAASTMNTQAVEFKPGWNNIKETGTIPNLQVGGQSLSSAAGQSVTQQDHALENEEDYDEDYDTDDLVSEHELSKLAAAFTDDKSVVNQDLLRETATLIGMLNDDEGPDNPSSLIADDEAAFKALKGALDQPSDEQTFAVKKEAVSLALVALLKAGGFSNEIQEQARCAMSFCNTDKELQSFWKQIPFDYDEKTVKDQKKETPISSGSRSPAASVSTKRTTPVAAKQPTSPLNFGVFQDIQNLS